MLKPLQIKKRLLKSPLLRDVISWGVENMSFVIPVKRLKETPTLIAFCHPSPTYATHILLIPKKALPSLLDLSPENTPLLEDLFATVQELVKELHLEDKGYRLIVNGGNYQEFPQLHFHLISGDEIINSH
jgi:histidine triad (HIT) family protein